MRTLRIIILLVFSAIALLCQSVEAKTSRSNQNQARRVAKNWIKLIVRQQGDWGGAEKAYVDKVEEFKRDDRVLGYFCSVKPSGFIVVSLCKGLAPVKAYSSKNDLDPEVDEGMVDLLKWKMERVLTAVETTVGPIETSTEEDLAAIVDIDYSSDWAELEKDEQAFEMSLSGDVSSMNYEEGEVLLTTDWHQTDPYNRQCPAPPDGNECTADHCTVGCVATAGAQIARYWCWPPYGVGVPYDDTYDWVNMPDSLSPGSTTPQINAVAELCSEVGVAAEMNYCGYENCASGAEVTTMRDAYENQYRYSIDCTIEYRIDYTAVNWFARMKSQFNLNRPIQYQVPGHSLVADGWNEIGSTPIRLYHMNYGWTGTSYDTWYTLDALPLGDPNSILECTIKNIVPAQALGSTISGTYVAGSFPYRYFDQDTTGYSADFAVGQNLQFLPGVSVNCLSTLGNTIRFEGATGDGTRLYSNGDMTRGVRIYNGAIVLHGQGGIRVD